MENRYLGKYLNKTMRLSNVDYGGRNDYFITLVVQHRIPAFGEIIDENMILSELGEVAWQEWIKTAELRKSMNISLGEFIVMPDHFHAVLHIPANEHNRDFKPNKMGVQSQNLGSVIRGYKSAVTTYARKNGIGFNWQNGYYDRIIRSPYALKAIEKYIRENPKNYGKK